MMIQAYISTSFKQLAQNKGRSMLTMLGIIIGIGSVIFIMTTGEVAKRFLLSQISQFGTNVIEVTLPGTFGFGESKDIKLTEKDVQTIYDSSLLPETESISAPFTTQESVEYRGTITSVSVFGDRPTFFEINNLKVLHGKLYTQSDVDQAARVMVVTKTTADDIFGTTDVVGKRVKVGDTFLTIIGVIEEPSVGGFGPSGDLVFIPSTTVKQHYADAKDADTVNFLLVQFTQGTDSKSFQNRLDYVLWQLHGIKQNEKDPFVIVSREQALSIVDSVLLGIQAFVSAVAAISLLVGGIGIMNIMLVTVKERTKEIGLRKAIGAKNSSVLIQFLIESIVLTTAGGIIGILFGLGLSAGAVTLVNTFQPDWGVTFVFVPNALFIACGVSVTVGLVFGLYPALKASRLHPIEALRYE